MQKEINISIIIPVFNRPNEIDELLKTLVNQTVKPYEIIIVEDGSTQGAHEIVMKYKELLPLKYYTKANSGPGLSRNYGAERATGNYFIFFDSDCLIPKKYIETVLNRLSENYLDAFGGPDMAHESFSPIQKAISYSMTSFFTTGGIRGGKERMDKFHPRSFNMGFSDKVFASTEGFSNMRFGEDVDMSLRIIEAGFSTGLIKEAAVYHKRRTDLRKFFKQVHNSGIARINLYKRHPKSLKIVHFLPATFTCGIVFLLLSAILCWYALLPILFFVLLIFADSLVKTKNINVAILSIAASFVQLCAYGTGFIRSFWRRIILKKSEFHAFSKNFYK